MMAGLAGMEAADAFEASGLRGTQPLPIRKLVSFFVYEKERLQIMTKVVSRGTALHLNWADNDGTITVHPEDEDRFILKVSKAIELLKTGVDREDFEVQFNVLLNTLGAWIKGRNSIRDAYLTQRDDGMLFVVINSKAKYDDVFEDELTDLDIRIANDVDLKGFRLDVLSLPNTSSEGVDAFLNQDFVLHYAPANP